MKSQGPWARWKEESWLSSVTSAGWGPGGRVGGTERDSSTCRPVYIGPLALGFLR